MPLIPEAMMAMLATVRLGAVHSVVFGGKRAIFVEIHCKIFSKLLIYRYSAKPSSSTSNLGICHSIRSKNKYFKMYTNVNTDLVAVLTPK